MERDGHGDDWGVSVQATPEPSGSITGLRPRESWTDESALVEVRWLADQSKRDREADRHSAMHARWRARTFAFLEEIFGRDSHYYREFSRLTWAAGQYFIDECEVEYHVPVDQVVEKKHDRAYRQQLETARGLLQAAADELERRGIDAVYRGKNTPAESSGILRVLALVERKLRKAIHSEPTAEKQIQDAFETLLHGADIGFSRESERIAYSSKSYVPDFVLPRLDLVVEFKLCTNGREKAIIAEINDDIVAYRTRYGNLIFVVYDNGNIRDIDRFAASFEQQDHVLVRVVKH